MMYRELYQYLIQYKQLSVPGIGTFLLNRKPAMVDFPNKIINPPVYNISLNYPASASSTSFFTWLANVLSISDREAVIKFNDFAFDMKKQLTNGDTINWSGVGTFNKGLSGEVKFLPIADEIILEKPLAAEKVIREKAAHTVRVGEDERTSAEMTEFLAPATKVKSYWWTWALVLGLIAIMFLGWYFSEHGISLFSVANTGQLTPMEPASTYQSLP